jgi:transposase
LKSQLKLEHNPLDADVDMSRFPSAAHLASWVVGLCPGNNESAGRHRSGKTRKGSTELPAVLTESTWAAARTSTYVSAQFRRFFTADSVRKEDGKRRSPPPTLSS